MKYYCKNCGAEFHNVPKDDYKACPMCACMEIRCPPDRTPALASIPAFETVSQWEARTGREYPDSAPVYVVGYDRRDEPWLTSRKGANNAHWRNDMCLVATEAGAPPDDWRPEEEA